MRCPHCQADEMKVIDSRNAAELNAIRRRRQCLTCGERFTTFETVNAGMQVLKRDGRYEDFHVTKLELGLQAACRHTRVSRDRVKAITAEIVSELHQRGLGTVSAHELGEIVMRHLHEEDHIAYIRFACVYRRFKDIDQLIEAIASIDEEEKARLAEIDKSFQEVS